MTSEDKSEQAPAGSTCMRSRGCVQGGAPRGVALLGLERADEARPAGGGGGALGAVAARHARRARLLGGNLPAANLGRRFWQMTL